MSASASKRSIYRAVQDLTRLSGVAAIRQGLISIIPILLCGAMALTARFFPIDGYQSFLHSFGDGILDTLLGAIYDVTFGLLSVYMCLTMGYHYAILCDRREAEATIGCSMVSLASFVALTGISHIDTLGPKGMFIAIVASLSGSAFFLWLLSHLKVKRLLTDGADVNLNNSLRLILPFSVTVIAFVLLNQGIMWAFDGMRIYDVFMLVMRKLFSLLGDGFLAGLVFVLMSSVLWFFGIHGSDVLEGVAVEHFVPNVDINMALAAAGEAPTQIFTKQFFDVFVLMGGCGSAMCLLLALLIFGRQKSHRGLAKMAAFPMLFNINEIMVFGLPIIYNPIMLIPFLCVPLVCFLTTYIAMATGLVPLVISPVEWTTPVLFGGYIATGSLRGTLLQLVNLALGVAIYQPFVKKYDAERQVGAKRDYDHLVEQLRRRELSREDVVLTELPGSDGAFAKSLAAEIGYAIAEEKPQVYYQPQFNVAGECFGAEALLRFPLEGIGMVYPPLVIELARESGQLQELEKYVFRRAFADAQLLWAQAGRPLDISVNISASSLQSADFEKFLIELAHSYEGEHRLCIEVTEQMAIVFDEVLKERIMRLREAGYTFAIDDFSAGNTSLQYLQENFFDVVKLDGSIVQNCLTNPRCNELTTMIIEMSHNLGFEVVAEFVSTEEIRDCMARAGCTMYQGWLYSPAITFPEMQKLLGGEMLRAK